MDKTQLFLTYEIELNDDRLPVAISVSFQSPVKGTTVAKDVNKVDRLRFLSDYKLTKFGEVEAPNVPREITKLLK